MQHTEVRLKAEWEEQSAIMLTLPKLEESWYRDFPEIEDSILEIVKEISQDQKVILSSIEKIKITEKLSSLGANLNNINIFEIEADDIWARDHGPITVFENSKKKFLDFTFNGWGNKFIAQKDNMINSRLKQEKVFDNLETIDFILEGGSIETDGQGTIMTTSECLLNSNRNIGFSKEQIEEILKKYLNAKRILWLNSGFLSGDDTDCHIDNLARFAPNNTIIYITEKNPSDIHFEPLQKMKKEILNFRQINNQEYNFFELPLPKPIFDKEGIRLPASYANFLIINTKVLLPIFNDPSDLEALNVLQQCFPTREIIPINGHNLIIGRGGIHCVTMQIN